MRNKTWYEVKIIGGGSNTIGCMHPFTEETVLAKVRSLGLACIVKYKFEEIYKGAKVWVE